MLKYLNVKEVFREIPEEISLAVSITGCVLHCKGCHSRELWEDKGTILDINQLDILLRAHQGISCILLMGAEHNIDALTELFMYAHKRVKTAWYCGLKEIPKNKRGILQYLDYVKVGPFIKELGGLDSPTTNQRLYKIEHQGNGEYWETDITHLLQNNKLNKETKNDN